MGFSHPTRGVIFLAYSKKGSYGSSLVDTCGSYQHIKADVDIQGPSSHVPVLHFKVHTRFLPPTTYPPYNPHDLMTPHTFAMLNSVSCFLSTSAIFPCFLVISVNVQSASLSPCAVLFQVPLIYNKIFPPIME